MAELLDPGDEAFVGAFNHLPRILVAVDCAAVAAGRTLANERPAGGTAIYDAIFASRPMFQRRQRTRAAMIVISDGADTASDHSLPADARDAAAQRRVRLRDRDRFGHGAAGEHARESRGAARNHRSERRLYRGRAERPRISALRRSASPRS